MPHLLLPIALTNHKTLPQNASASQYPLRGVRVRNTYAKDRDIHCTTYDDVHKYGYNHS